MMLAHAYACHVCSLVHDASAHVAGHMDAAVTHCTWRRGTVQSAYLGFTFGILYRVPMT